MSIDPDSSKKKKNAEHREPKLIRSSIGFDFAAAVAGLTLLGWAFDRFQGTEPWGMLIGAGLGIVGGLYNSIKAAGVIGRKPQGKVVDGDREDGG